MNIARHISIFGRVQGVGYRAFVEDEALRRGVCGWVRNRRDGSVEAMFAGEAAVVADLIETCRRGPPVAQVATLDQREPSADELKLSRPGELFSVLSTV